MDLKYEFYYKFKEVTTEKYGDIENVIIEIRFFHVQLRKVIVAFEVKNVKIKFFGLILIFW